MCGIVGLVSKKAHGFANVHSTLFTQMLIVNQLRGVDSTGAFGCADKLKSPEILKSAMHATDFISTKEYDAFNNEIFRTYHTVVGHNRAATKGTISAENAHPFQEGRITLVHNGTILNQDELTNEAAEIDSHAICHALNENTPEVGLSLINGAYALVWHDSESNTINLARNKQRPLWYAEFDDFWAIASEPALIFYVCGRNNLKPKNYQEVPEKKIVTFALDSREDAPSIAEYQEWTAPVKVWPTYAPPSNVVQFPKQDNTKFSKGSLVHIKFVDSKPATTGVHILGHPVYIKEGFIDENITVHYWSRSDSEETVKGFLEEGNFYTGLVLSHHTERGLPILYVHDVAKTVLRQSKNGELFTHGRFVSMEKSACKECGETEFMSFDNIPNIFAKPRKDGTWRVICPTCFSKPLTGTTIH